MSLPNISTQQANKTRIFFQSREREQGGYIYWLKLQTNKISRIDIWGETIYSTKTFPYFSNQLQGETDFYDFETHNKILTQKEITDLEYKKNIINQYIKDSKLNNYPNLWE